MSSPTQTIKALLPCLPDEDIPFAKRFFDTRDWESLKELTWSSFKRMEKAIKAGKVPDKYKNKDIDKVEELALLCHEHYTIIFPDDDFVDETTEDDDFVDEETW